MNRLAILAFLIAAPVLAQRPYIQASGEGAVNIRPDQVIISVGVTTEGQTAQEAADRNATQAAAVLAALRQLLGPTAQIETIAYSISPIYRSQPGTAPTITGYTANNTLQVTSGDLTLAGRVIDVAAQAGANTVSGLNFTLKDPEPARLTALTQATQRARARANAIAQGLNARLGSVVAASEGYSVLPIGGGGRDSLAATTPIEPGSLSIRASVTLQIEIAQ